jgi:hypothetical protein
MRTTGWIGEGKNLLTDSHREGICTLVGGNDVNLKCFYYLNQNQNPRNLTKNERMKFNS